MINNAKASSREFKNFNLSSTGKAIISTLLILVSTLILGLLFAGIFGAADELISVADNLVSLIFLALFFFLYSNAIDRKMYLRNNWVFLLGALPVPYVASDSTLLSVAVALLLASRFIVRLILLIKVSRSIIPKFYALQVVTVLTFFVMLSTELFYIAEHATNPQVQTHFDSFYWTIVTSTTIGYGDITPITLWGRIIAIFMMILGIGIFGLVTGSTASFFTKRIKQRYEKFENVNSFID